MNEGTRQATRASTYEIQENEQSYYYIAERQTHICKL